MTRTATNSWGSERQVFSQVWWSLASAASEAKVKGPLELPSPGPAWAEDFISNTEKNEVFLTKTRHILTKKTLMDTVLTVGSLVHLVFLHFYNL